MSDHSEAFVAFDTAKLRNAVAIADGGRGDEVRFLGEFDNTPAATAKLVRKLAAKYERLTFCYEAGPTGYGLYRQIKSLGHECIVGAPSLIPKKAGDRVKTNRRDAISLAKLLRSGDLSAVWVPDRQHEAMRELTRARETAMNDLRAKRQQISAFLLRRGVHYSYCVTNFCANFVGNCAHMQDIAAAEPGRLRKPLCDGGSRSSWGRDVAAAAAAPRGR